MHLDVAVKIFLYSNSNKYSTLDDRSDAAEVSVIIGDNLINSHMVDLDMSS